MLAITEKLCKFSAVAIYIVNGISTHHVIHEKLDILKTHTTVENAIPAFIDYNQFCNLIRLWVSVNECKRYSLLNLQRTCCIVYKSIVNEINYDGCSRTCWKKL